MPRRLLKLKCRKCNGSGKTTLVELHPSLDQTLDLLISLKRPATAPELYESQSEELRGTSPTSMNNQLEDLRALGFVNRQRHGKSWQYFPIRKAK